MWQLRHGMRVEVDLVTADGSTIAKTLSWTGLDAFKET